MPPVKELEDQNQLVATSKFPSYAKFPFDEFNPVQSRILEIYDKDANVIVAAATSAGKTVTAEMVAAHEIRQRGRKVIYLAPLRALAKEKLDDWTDKNHHFGGLNIAICTGDYRLTPARKKEMEEANIIVMTSEMLSSRCRNYKSEQNDFLKDVGVCIVDESHLLTVDGRGDHLEVGLMKFCEINKDVRFVFLSATMPNVKEIAEWVSYVLTGKETYLINSTYRPCPLGIHWEMHPDKGSYYEIEEHKVNTTLEIVKEYAEDSFILFVHTKGTGKLLEGALTRVGIACEFHSADLTKEERHRIEDNFKHNREPRVIVATSTLAWGVNTSARRVVVVGITRGLNDVEWYDIWQECGRAGRPGYNTRGDAHILLPERTAADHKEELSKPHNIQSRLLDHTGDGDKKKYKTLAFHLVSEIHRGVIVTKDDVHDWYQKTLAHFQARDLDEEIVDATLDSLLRCRAIQEENGEHTVSTIGKVASMFYFSPFDTADLRRNFNYLFSTSGAASDDIAVSMMLGGVDTHKSGFVSRAEQEEMSSYETRVKNIMGDVFNGPAIKAGYAYFTLLRGLNPGAFASMARNLQFDFPRTVEVLRALDYLGYRWERQNWFRDLSIRVSYGVKPEFVPLCRISEIGKARAERLWAAGLKTPERIANSRSHVQKVLNVNDKKMDKIISSATAMVLAGEC